MVYFKVQFAGYEGPRHVALERKPMTCGCEESLQEAIEWSFRENNGVPQDETLTIEWTRELRRQSPVGVITYRVVREWRCYGGPEEGGWYYTEEELLKEFTVPVARGRRHKERLERYCDAQNEQIRGGGCEGKYAVYTGAWKAQRRPHYC